MAPLIRFVEPAVEPVSDENTRTAESPRFAEVEPMPTEQERAGQRAAAAGHQMPPRPDANRRPPDNWPVGSAHQHLAALVHRIYLAPERAEDSIRSVMFAGIDAGQPSPLSAVAAEVLAARVDETDTRVDANLRAPSLHLRYGVPNDLGLRQALCTEESFRTYVRRLAGCQGSLWLLPAGPFEDDEQGVSGRDPRRMRDLLCAFDYIVIEAPPVTRDAVACSLGAYVDGVVLVAEANVTRRRAVRAAVDSLRSCGCRLLGTVLNNRTFPIPQMIYDIV
jgi:Mrp family chromosome partitioning ATPase